MKLGHFKKGHQSRLVILKEETAIDVNALQGHLLKDNGYYQPFQKAEQVFSSSLAKSLSLYQEYTLDKLKELAVSYEDYQQKGVELDQVTYKLSNIELDKPLDQIATYRDFYIHEKHVKKGFEKRGEEIPAPWFELPVYYKGNTASFFGPQEEIIWPHYSDKLDYELELAAIIGRDGQNIKASDAEKHLFGFTILNDVSARDIQKKEMAVRLGPSKGKDFCSIIGPVIVTADELGVNPNLKMQAFINDELWSEGFSGEGKYSWAEMIEFASQEEWVLATDLMGSGTVGTGCGLEIDKWIKPGDEIRLVVENIGELKNTVGAKRKEKIKAKGK